MMRLDNGNVMYGYTITLETCHLSYRYTVRLEMGTEGTIHSETYTLMLSIIWNLYSATYLRLTYSKAWQPKNI